MRQIGVFGAECPVVFAIRQPYTALQPAIERRSWSYETFQRRHADCCRGAGRAALLARTLDAAQDGKHELFKSSHR
jgi:hypothetical protein